MTQVTQNVRLIELGVSQVNVNARDLGLAMAALAQAQARGRLEKATSPTYTDAAATAAAIAALTDSSTGTAAAAVLAAVPVGIAAVNPASAPTKTSFDTQIGLVEDAHEELRGKINAMINVVAGSTARIVETASGANPDNTIAAIAAFTNGTDDTVDFATGNLEIVRQRNNQASLCAALNYLRVALGLNTITDGTGGTFVVTTTLYPNDDALATGAAAANPGDATMTAASALAALNALKNNIATIAARLNEMRGTLAVGPFVVATNNPRTRFKLADITL